MQDLSALFGALSLSDTTRDSFYDDSDILSVISLTDSFSELDLSGFDEDFYKKNKYIYMSIVGSF
jgi:hypothetical protein